MFWYNDYALTLLVFFFFCFFSLSCYLFLVRIMRVMTGGEGEDLRNTFLYFFSLSDYLIMPPSLGR